MCHVGTVVAAVWGVSAPNSVATVPERAKDPYLLRSFFALENAEELVKGRGFDWKLGQQLPERLKKTACDIHAYFPW